MCKRCACSTGFLLKTDLFTVTSGLATEAVMAAIPPACRRAPEGTRPFMREGGDAVVELGPWRPRAAARHFVPALSVLGSVDYAFRFELSTATARGWSPWIATAT